MSDGGEEVPQVQGGGGDRDGNEVTILDACAVQGSLPCPSWVWGRAECVGTLRVCAFKGYFRLDWVERDAGANPTVAMSRTERSTSSSLSSPYSSTAAPSTTVKTRTKYLFSPPNCSVFSPPLSSAGNGIAQLFLQFS